MKTLKMSLANIQGKMSRMEMRNIMAGSEGVTCASKPKNQCSGSCTDGFGNSGTCDWYNLNPGGCICTN